ncbi:MAG: pilus assembly protein [Chloroflexi bacterium]|nr:pilus assembly protein [Chloroflexota bacterium]
MNRRQILCQFCRNEKGATLVETVLTLIVLLPILVGVIDIGRAFSAYIVLTNASREGARYASRYPFHSEGIAAAVRQEAATGGLVAEAVQVNIDGLNGPAGTPIAVTASYQVNTICGSLVGLPSLQLHSTTRMVIFGLDTVVVGG